MQRYNINNRLAYLSGGVQSAGGMWPSVSAWTPASATTSGGVSPVQWYDAGTIAGLSDGNSVTSWTDSAGSYDLVSSGTYFGNEAAPTYYSSVANSLPVVRYSGGTATEILWYDGTAPISGTDARSIFVVCKPDIATETRAMVGLGALDGGSTAGTGWFMTPEVAVRCYAGTTWVSTTRASTSAFNIVVSTYSGSGNLHANTTMRLNGAGVTRTSGGDGSINTGNAHFTVGHIATAATIGTTNCFDGDIAEVIVYEASLSAADLAQVEGYLADKYAITI